MLKGNTHPCEAEGGITMPRYRKEPQPPLPPEEVAFQEEMHRLLLFLLIIPTIFWYAGVLDGEID